MEIYEVEGWVLANAWERDWDLEDPVADYQSFGYAHSVKEYKALAERVAGDCLGTVYVYRIRDDGERIPAAYLFNPKSFGGRASKWRFFKRPSFN
jgi:hypothetical protein